ncbi:hypothetical protein [Leptospira stimsonii]|uniref:Uncharacterized protein n=1 Tax=Leptospira stimsonii TaxID=2202203 RepID=A0ABY2N8Z7_9LEPT|nr:hypothetical protein [Leptospira stimsonii]TGK12856.1 hypothetical protein EHO98_19660 [Leptospira stimsonii]TGM18790.1 hypothetical protein EHQ90_06380 [Leptospira stimsonii]
MSTIPLQILRPVYNKSDNSLEEGNSEKITIFVDHFKPVTRIRNTDNGAVYTSLEATIPADANIRQTDLIAYPQGLSDIEFSTKGKWLPILKWYQPRDPNGEIDHIEVEA